MRRPIGGEAVGYVMAAVAVACAIGVRLSLDPLLGNEATFLLNLPAVLIVAWHFGLAPALFASALGVAGTWYFVCEPRWSWAGRADSFAGILLTGVVACCIAWTTASVRRTRAREHAHAHRLAESEAFTRRVTDIAPCILYIYDLDARANVWGNRTMIEMLGYSHDDIQSMSGDLLGKLLHPDDLPAYREHAGRLATLADGESAEFEYRMRNADGSWRWLNSRDMAFRRDEAGRVTQIIGAALDVTDRVEAREALSASEARFRRAMRSVTGVVWEWDLRANTVYRSEGLHDLIGVRPEEAPPTCEWWRDRIHPEDLSRLLAIARQTMDHVDQFSSDYRVRHEDGRWIDVWERGIILRDDGGQPVRFIGFTTDIRDRKAAERALQEADRHKNEFLATLSHELRNPLAALSMSIELMDRLGAKDSVTAPTRGTMRRQVKQLTHLVDDLLDVSRISRDKLVLKLERVELVCLLQRSIDDARPMCDARRHRLEITLPEAPILLQADPTRLAQVVGNLLNNACKYTPEGGTIRLVARRETDEVVIELSDTGVGIEAENLARVFGLFEQIKSDGHLAGGGLGIGLSLVQRLVQMHGGSVEARSPGRGKGSTFIVRLPVVDLPGPDPADSVVDERAAQATASASDEVGTQRVLVVDDNVDAALMLAELLTMHGHHARVVHDGPQAIELSEQLAPDVVLLDIGLPSMSGHDVCRAIRSKLTGREPLMIAVTGWGQEEDRRRTADAGFDHHLVKPVDVEKLRALLRDLRGKRLEQTAMISNNAVRA